MLLLTPTSTPVILGLSLLLPLASAAVLPNSSSSKGKTSTARAKGVKSTPDQWCTPWFSGLVQTVKKTNRVDIVWKAVSASEGRVMDGVKATSVGKSKEALMEPDLEWFVTPTLEGLFELTSGAAPSNCDSRPSALDTLSQHALVPSYLTAECATPHLFSILCTSCDRHSDSASGCLLHSQSRNQCVELSDEGKLQWGECTDLMRGKRSRIGEEERDLRRSRQTWDISP